jgi:3-methyladenine DNA glycosylase AlkC
MTSSGRKGARSIKDIPADILRQLNHGDIETANLVECLAIDQPLLLDNLLAQTGRTQYSASVKDNMAGLKKKTVNTLSEAIGCGLFAAATQNGDDEFLEIIAAHPSDLVRCWAAYAIGRNAGLNLGKTLERIRLFAKDAHFGVREVAWLAIRPRIAAQLEAGIAILARWSADSDLNIRRFASESTRPRGVWCAHIETLKQNPALGLPILEPLKSDPEKYVQDSVGNWLNDASKTQPEFVRALCAQWLAASPAKATEYIANRALRTVGWK